MLNSSILEVAIGIVMLYAILSMLVSTIREGIEALLKTRASYLERTIRELLDEAGDGKSKGGKADGEKLTAAIYQHPQIFGLFTGTYDDAGGTKKNSWITRGRNLPSYIPSRNFALALLDMVACGGPKASEKATVHGGLSLARVRANLNLIGNPQVKQALSNAIDTAENDLGKAIANVETWYDSAMERATGRYRRSSQFFLIAIGLAVAIGFNINTFEIADFLYRHPTERGVLIARAQALSASQSAVASSQSDVVRELRDMHLPIGWAHTRPIDCSISGWLAAFLGWLLTGFAVTLGAPFWFDVLNKFVLLRASLKPDDKSASKPPEAPAPPKPAIAPAAGAMAADRSQAPSADPEMHEDGCDLSDEAVPPTEDRDLPAADGGVA